MPSRCEKWTYEYGASHPQKLFLKLYATFLKLCASRNWCLVSPLQITLCLKSEWVATYYVLFFSLLLPLLNVFPYFESICVLYLISFSSCLLQMEAKIVSWMNFDLECHQTIEARLEILHELPANLSRDLQRHLYRWCYPMWSTPPETLPGPFLQQQDILMTRFVDVLA